MKICPICYERLDVVTGTCRFCGFNQNDLYDTSNALVPKMKKLDPTTIVETNIIPDDVNKKKLVLLTIFVGLFGAHMFYIHKKKTAIFYLVSTILMLICIPFEVELLPMPFLHPEQLSTIGSVPFTLTVIFWLGDIIKLIFKKFKLPVVLKSRL